MTEKISRYDLKLIARDAGVKTTTVLTLLKGGVTFEAVDTVLELRNSLVSYDKDGNIRGQGTAATLCIGWKACEGDIDVLNIVVDRALEIVHRRFTPDNYGCFHTNQWNFALFSALRQYKRRGAAGLNQ